MVWKCVLQRDQLHQQEALVSSLQQQLRKVTDSQSSKQQLLGREEGGLLHHNASLKDSNTRMTEQLFRMKEKNEKLEEVSTPTYHHISTYHHIPTHLYHHIPTHPPRCDSSLYSVVQ